MGRAKFAMDLLREGITVEGEIEIMRSKRELTDLDLQIIINNCRKVEKAARYLKGDLD